MRLYHGSYCKIGEIDLSHGRSYKDFGRGFYLTPDFSRAVTMANRSVVLNHRGEAEVTAFLFYKSKCPGDVRIKEFKTTNWEWAQFVMMNRDKAIAPPYKHEYDIVIGPVADSSVDSEIQAYKSEYGSDYALRENLAILAQRLRYSGNYIQYCFCTLKGVGQLIKE